MSKLIYAVIMPCQKAGVLIEKSQLSKLTLFEKIRLKFHLSQCTACKVYQEQSIFIQKLLIQKMNIADNEAFKLKVKQSLK